MVKSGNEISLPSTEVVERESKVVKHRHGPRRMWWLAVSQPWTVFVLTLLNRGGLWVSTRGLRRHRSPFFRLVSLLYLAFGKKNPDCPAVRRKGGRGKKKKEISSHLCTSDLAESRAFKPHRAYA